MYNLYMICRRLIHIKAQRLKTSTDGNSAAVAEDNHQNLLTIAEAARLLNVSKMTIRRWTNSGKLKCVRMGVRKERRFLEADLLAMLSDGDLSDLHTKQDTDHAPGTHRCVVCDESMQGWDAVVREMLSHNAAGSHITFVGDDERMDRLAEALRNNQLALEEMKLAGRIRCLTIEESYLLAGEFSGERAAAFVESTILYATSLGFKQSLFVGWSDWVSQVSYLGEQKLMTEVIAYERNLDRLIRRYPQASVLCPYSFDNLTSKTLLELTSFHTQIQFHSRRVYGLNV